MTDVLRHNRAAWNAESTSGESPWCQIVDELTIASARGGRWAVILTPLKPVPLHWFDGLQGKQVLCLASGGGQQAPVLAAAGAAVTSFDLSEEQLAKDKAVADREGLTIDCVRGDMADLSCFASESFDLIFNPASIMFAANVRAVWQGCSRVLKRSGRLLSGFMNPDYYLFDHDELQLGEPPTVRYPLPFAASTDLPQDRLRAKLGRNEPLEFSHSLEEQIGGQIDAGFTIAGLYEDKWSDEATPLNAYMPTSIATLAIKSR